MPQNDTNQVRKPSSQILEHLRKCSAEHKDEVSTSSTAPFLTVIKTDGEPYALRDARTVRGEALGNLFGLCQIRRPLPTPFFPNATRCIDFFHVAQWINKALDEVRISTAAKAKREYNNLREEYIRAEAEAAAAAEKAKQDYQDALRELAQMPHRGRPSDRKQELVSFIVNFHKNV